MSGTAHTPAHSNLFNVRSIQDSPELPDAEREIFHSVTAQLTALVPGEESTSGLASCSVLFDQESDASPGG